MMKRFTPTGDQADHDALHLQHARPDREFQPCKRRYALDFVRHAGLQIRLQPLPERAAISSAPSQPIRSLRAAG